MRNEAMKSKSEQEMVKLKNIISAIDVIRGRLRRSREHFSEPNNLESKEKQMQCPACKADCSDVEYDEDIEFEDEGVTYHAAECNCGAEILVGVRSGEIVSVEWGGGE